MHNKKIMENLGSKVAEISIQYRWLLILASIAISVVISYGAANLKFAPDYRVFFGADNPDFIANEKAQDTFGRPDNVAFLIIPKDGKLFTPDHIAAVHELTQASWRLPYVSRVDSLSNFQNTRGETDDLIVEDLLFDVSEINDKKLAEMMIVAQGEPLLNGFVVSKDGKATLINAVIQAPTEIPNIASTIAQSARDIRDEILANHPNLQIEIVGVAMLSAAFEEAGVSDSQTLIPLVYVLIIVVLLVTLRSVAGAVASLLLIALSTLIGMGIGGFSGVLLTPISLSAPTIILTIAVADAIHVISMIKTKMQLGMNKRDAIVTSISLNFTPIGITSITTIVGFLSLNFSDSPPFHHLGNITAAGIFAAWLFSLTFLPAMLSLLPMRYKNRVGVVSSGASSSQKRPTSFMGQYANWLINKPHAVFISTTIVSVLLIAAIPKMEINDQWSNYFDDSLEFKQALNAAEPYFGTDTIEFVLDAGEQGGVTKPEFLRLVDDFTSWLNQQSDVVAHAYSISEIMKRVNMNLNADDPSYFAIPDDQTLAGQYLFVYELSLPFGLDINDRIDIDRQATRITATTRDISTNATKAFLSDAEQWFAQNAQGIATMESTGSKKLFAFVAKRNIDAVFESAIVLIIAIFLILSLAFRSMKIGLLSLIPNAIPILATFGTWALLVGTVGFSVAAVGAVAIGLVVDFTVHFMSKYLRAVQTDGLTVEQAVKYAFDTAGNAIFATTVVLAAGFAILATSSFKLNADLGLLTAIAVLFAMIINFTLLPSFFLMRSKTRGSVLPKDAQVEQIEKPQQGKDAPNEVIPNLATKD